ncbi:MAG: cupin domain-containing protein [Chitinophagaceae bacterium]
MKTTINANELEFEPTAHGAGLKKVLIQSFDTSTKLTQLALGKLKPGESISPHSHNSMEEIFYFLKGEGIYIIDQENISVTPSMVVRIPAGVQHSLTAIGITELEFIYLGIATG